MLDRFVLHRPRTVIEASQLLAELGPEATIYAGGTELLIVMKERLAHFPHVIDIKTIPGLCDIALDPEWDELVIGALATHREIEHSPLVREHIPALAALATRVANVRVRAAGTIGGNLCFAEPHSDPATLLAALDARLTLVSVSGERVVPMDAFITGLMETSRRPDEILTEIRLPLLSSAAGVAYARIKLHERPTAAVAAVIALSDGAISGCRVVAGSVGERPQRLPRTERFLRDRPATAATAGEAASIIRDEVEISADPFESEEYKRQLARTVGRKAIASALRQAAREGGHHAV